LNNLRLNHWLYSVKVCSQNCRTERETRIESDLFGLSRHIGITCWMFKRRGLTRTVYAKPVGVWWLR
jgi:hypothetical protein